MPTAPRISVLTLADSPYGLRLLNWLRQSDIPVAQVVAFSGSRRYRWRWLRRAARRVGWRDVLAWAVARARAPTLGPTDAWQGQPLVRDRRRLADRLDSVPVERPEALVAALRRAEPQLCLLAGAPIIPAAALAVPTWGSLNAHPGILPEYRGMDPYRWAVYNGDFDRVGCTLHLVDAGIDTGPVLRRHPYTWKGDESVGLLGWRLWETCLDLLVEACRAPWPAVREQALPQGAGRQYYLMPPRLWPEADGRLRQFLAARRM